MKSRALQLRFLGCTAALLLGVASTAVRAAGTHAGGHDDAIGVPGDAAKVTRTIAVDMNDNMRFTPARISVRRGKTIRFRVTNSGRLKHELVLGTKQELEEHYKAMLKFPEMEHEEENMITLAPAKTGEIVWKFTRSGQVDFACLQPGHYDAGMKGQIVVTSTKEQRRK